MREGSASGLSAEATGVCTCCFRALLRAGCCCHRCPVARDIKKTCAPCRFGTDRLLAAGPKGAATGYARAAPIHHRREKGSEQRGGQSLPQHHPGRQPRGNVCPAPAIFGARAQRAVKPAAARLLPFAPRAWAFSARLPASPHPLAGAPVLAESLERAHPARRLLGVPAVS